MRRVKLVHFAHPTSALAEACGCSEAGCYAVSVGPANAPHDFGVQKHYGPFATIQEAEQRADSLPEAWCSVYQRYPLAGSRFQVSEPTSQGDQLLLGGVAPVRPAPKPKARPDQKPLDYGLFAPIQGDLADFT
jgi:hypothetical protein